MNFDVSFPMYQLSNYTEAKHEDNSGMALLIVIIVLIIVSVILVGIVTRTEHEFRLAHSNLVSSESRAFGDAIIMQISFLLDDTASQNRPRVDGIPETIDVLSHPVTISIVSELGKIDLNASDALTLTNLFEAAGEGPAIAVAESQEVINWRTGGYGAIVVTPFHTVQELRQVSGITDDLFNLLLPSITVDNSNGTVDPNTAPLLALEASQKMSRLSADDFIRQRTTDQNLNSFDGVKNGQIMPGTDLTGWPFTVHAQFIIYQHTINVTGIIIMNGNKAMPYLVLWKDFIPE